MLGTTTTSTFSGTAVEFFVAGIFCWLFFFFSSYFSFISVLFHRTSFPSFRLIGVCAVRAFSVFHSSYMPLQIIHYGYSIQRNTKIYFHFYFIRLLFRIEVVFCCFIQYFSFSFNSLPSATSSSDIVAILLSCTYIQFVVS